MAVVFENEGSDVDLELFGIPQDGMYGQPNKDSSTSGGSALKRKRDEEKAEVKGYTSADVNAMDEEEVKREPGEGCHRVTGNVRSTLVQFSEC